MSFPAKAFTTLSGKLLAVMKDIIPVLEGENKSLWVRVVNN